MRLRRVCLFLFFFNVYGVFLVLSQVVWCAAKSFYTTENWHYQCSKTSCWQGTCICVLLKDLYLRLKTFFLLLKCNLVLNQRPVQILDYFKISLLQNAIHNHIRLFEPLVIKALKQYTTTTSVQLQRQVLDLLAQLVQLRVNYCLLDSDQVGISSWYVDINSRLNIYSKNTCNNPSIVV